MKRNRGRVSELEIIAFSPQIYIYIYLKELSEKYIVQNFSLLHLKHKKVQGRLCVFSNVYKYPNRGSFKTYKRMCGKIYIEALFFKCVNRYDTFRVSLERSVYACLLVVIYNMFLASLPWKTTLGKQGFYCFNHFF